MEASFSLEFHIRDMIGQSARYYFRLMTTLSGKKINEDDDASGHSISGAKPPKLCFIVCNKV